MNNTFKILLAGALVGLALQQWQLQRQLQELQVARSEIAATRQLPAAGATAPALPDPAIQANADLAQNAELKEIRALLAQHQQLARTAQQASVGVGVGVGAGTGEGVENEAVRFSQTIENTLALGTLDSQAWVEMEADMTRMSKAQNRAFWIQVFGGIERGELQMIPPEETQ